MDQVIVDLRQIARVVDDLADDDLFLAVFITGATAVDADRFVDSAERLSWGRTGY